MNIDKETDDVKARTSPIKFPRYIPKEEVILILINHSMIIIVQQNQI